MCVLHVCHGFVVLQATEAELKNQIERLTDQCTRLDTRLREASSETDELRVKLLDRQTIHLPPDTSESLLQSLQQQIAANKVCSSFSANTVIYFLC